MGRPIKQYNEKKRPDRESDRAFFLIYQPPIRVMTEEAMIMIR